MATVSVTLDRDLHARVSKYADGAGVPLETVLERALKFALKTRYDAGNQPDQSLPGRERPVDPGYGQEGGSTKPGSDGARPDQSLPGSRRCPVFDASIDNELPEGEVPEVDNELPETAEPK